MIIYTLNAYSATKSNYTKLIENGYFDVNNACAYLDETKYHISSDPDTKRLWWENIGTFTVMSSPNSATNMQFFEEFI